MVTAALEEWSCVRGYHINKDVYTVCRQLQSARIKLLCKRERNKHHNIYAVAVVKGDVVVGLLTMQNFTPLVIISKERWLNPLPEFRKTTTFIRFEAMGTGNAC